MKHRVTTGDEWYTPQVIIEAARATMGRIDLDAASCEEANAKVKANRIFTADDDGLRQDWKGTVWCSPPVSSGDLARWVNRCLEHPEPVCLLVAQGDVSGYAERLLEEADAICWIHHRLSTPTGEDGSWWGPNATNGQKVPWNVKPLVVAMLRCEPKGDEWAGIGPVRYRRPQPITGSDGAAGC